jgi:ribosomal protein S10
MTDKKKDLNLSSGDIFNNIESTAKKMKSSAQSKVVKPVIRESKKVSKKVTVASTQSDSDQSKTKKKDRTVLSEKPDSFSIKKNFKAVTAISTDSEVKGKLLHHHVEEVESLCFQMRYSSVSEGDFKSYTDFLKTLFKHIDIRCDSAFVYHVTFIKFPKERKRLTLFKSPHVHKKAKDQFERGIHSARVCIYVTQNSSTYFSTLLESLSINKPKSIYLSTELESNIGYTFEKKKARQGKAVDQSISWLVTFIENYFPLSETSTD